LKAKTKGAYLKPLMFWIQIRAVFYLILKRLEYYCVKNTLCWTCHLVKIIIRFLTLRRVIK